MKEKGLHPSAVEIILGDEEIRQEIRSLITVASNKGYAISDVGKALVKEWKEMIPPPLPDYVFTEDETAFVHDVDKFFLEYGKDLIKAYDRVCDYPHLKCENNEVQTTRVLTHLKINICAGYCSFCRNDSITMENMWRYAVNILGARKNFWVGRDEISALKFFFNNLFYPTSHDERPRYGEITKDTPSENKLYYNHSYQEFLNGYSFFNRDVVVAMLTVIWFIREYY